MTEQPTAAPGGEKVRPTFLTVLCILSFIGAGLTIILAIVAVLGMAAITAGAANIGAAGENAGALTMMWVWTAALVAMVIVSLIGVIKMWKLKKQGFFLYTGASVAGIIIGLISGPVNIMSILFSVLFIVLYGMNLKHMD